MRLIVDTAAFVAYADGEPLHLTPSEFDLLSVLAADPARVYTHDQLARRVFGAIRAQEPAKCRMALRHHAIRLRGKLREAGAEMVWNTHSRGYRLVSPTRPHDIIIGDGVATRAAVLA